MSEEFMLDKVSIRLVKERPLMADFPLNTPSKVVGLLGTLLCEADREVLAVINVQADGKPINCSIVSVGGLFDSIAQPREIMKSAILSNAAGFIMLHCHPSGNLVPSKEDCEITDRMNKVGSLVGIHLFDHIIVGGKADVFYSFLEKDLIDNPIKDYKTNDMDIEFGSKLPKGMEISPPAKKGRTR